METRNYYSRSVGGGYTEKVLFVLWEYAIFLDRYCDKINKVDLKKYTLVKTTLKTKK